MKRKLGVFFLIAVCAICICATAGESITSQYSDSGVSIENVKYHQRMLEKIAKKSGNMRASGMPGYENASAYVKSMLQLFGYEIETQEFEIPLYHELSDPVLEQISPQKVIYPANDDRGFYTLKYSGKGDVNGVVEPVDVMMPPSPEPNTSTSGCEASDFVNFTAGNIALVQRGGCRYYDKALNALNAGASAVIIFNEGQEGRKDAYKSSLRYIKVSIPSVLATYEIGEALYNASKKQRGGATVHIATNTISEWRKTENIIAETKCGDEKNTLIVGANLDSTFGSPGINANGSGVSTLLEMAIHLGLSDYKLKNKVKFAFWGAGEAGAYGSAWYLFTKTKEEIRNIGLYLNIDTIGSSNYARFVLDGDASDTGIGGPPGSEVIEQFFVNYFSKKNLPCDPYPIGKENDFTFFAEYEIPTGGLFSGSKGLKTTDQQKKYGGFAGEPFDPNYHTGDDLYEHINFEIEAQMVDAISAAAYHFAQNKLERVIYRTKEKRRFDSIESYMESLCDNDL